MPVILAMVKVGLSDLHHYITADVNPEFGKKKNRISNYFPVFSQRLSLEHSSYQYCIIVYFCI